MFDAMSQISLTKGVFIPNSPSKNTLKKERRTKDNCVPLHHAQYKATCESIENQMQEIEKAAYKDTFDALKDFINEYDVAKIEEAVEISTAILVMGVNMPDHCNIFRLLEERLNYSGFCITIKLQSKDCSTFFSLMQILVPGIINKYQQIIGGVDVNLKKVDCTVSKLLSFYENLPYLKPCRSLKKSAKHSGEQTDFKTGPIIILIEDVEAFDLNVLQVLIMNCHMYVDKLPFVLVFGMASAMVTLHDLLPQKVIACLSIETFCSFTAIEYLTKITQQVLLSTENPFRLGSKVFRLLVDTVLYHDFSVTNLNHMMKLCILEHFYSNDLAFLCCPESEISKNIEHLFPEQAEKIRNLPSVKRYLEENPQCKNELKKDNSLKLWIEKWLKHHHSYYRTFISYLNCLHILTRDLPGSPFGKHVREIYPLAIEGQLTSLPAYLQSTKLLKMQSREELISKLEKCIQELRSPNEEISEVKDILRSHLESLRNLTDMDFDRQSVIPDSSRLEKVMSRAQLQQRLMQNLKSASSKFESSRESVVDFFTSLFQKLQSPSCLPLCELLYFDDHLAIKHYLMAVPRIVLHQDLVAPNNYIKCDNASGPDLCVLYRLHLECGKLINLYDWLEAFKTFKENSKSKDCDDVRMNVRFMQGVSELRYLGFVKPTKKKTDHVTRLTFGSF